MDTSYAVFCGIDVGNGEHHAVGLDPSGGRLYDKALPNDETKLRAVFDGLAAHGPILVIVDQPNTIGALPVTVARACGHDVAYLPGLSMRRIADLYPAAGCRSRSSRTVGIGVIPTVMPRSRVGSGPHRGRMR